MFVKRDIDGEFRKRERAYGLITVVGARQAGKTTFLKEQGKEKKISYLLFDDQDIRTLFEEDIKKFEKQYLEGYEIAIFDEVQYCKNAGRNLKYLADSNRKIWLTASSEMILSKEVLSYLVGRVSVMRLYPFSLHEFLVAKSQKEFTKQMLERNIWEHINYGGYPKIVLEEDSELKKTILKDLYDTMVLKDIASVFSIEDIRSLEIFIKHLALNIGNVVSYETLTNDIKLSFQTIKKYLDAMEKSYLITRVKPYFNNKTKEIIKQPKIFFIDTGLRNIITKTFEIEPSGSLFENYVFSELVKLGFIPKYWRTKSKQEVDFIIEKDSEVIPIEVKLSSSEKIKEGFYSFIESYQSKRAFVVYYKGEERKEKRGKCEIEFVNISDLKKKLMG